MTRKILQVNFKLTGSRDDIVEARRIMSSGANEIAAVPGLCWKIWMLNSTEREAGGVYLFENGEFLNAYFDGPIISALKKLSGLSDFSFKSFDISEENSRITRAPIS